MSNKLLEHLDSIIEQCGWIETMNPPHPAKQRIELQASLCCDLLRKEGYSDSAESVKQAAKNFEKAFSVLWGKHTPRDAEEALMLAKRLGRLATRIKLTVEPYTDEGEENAPMRLGRKGADPATRSQEEKIFDDWRKAKAMGVRKVDFAKDQKLKLKGLNRILGTVSKRKKRADK